jgi:hypothetical protein
LQHGLQHRLVVAGALGIVFTGFTGGCPGTPVGLPCDVGADAGPAQAAFNDQALECSTRLCIHQAYAPQVAARVDTGSFCTADCRRDADCDGGWTRQSDQPGDLRCRSGFYCGVAMTTGPSACRRLCLCRDFVGSDTETPAVCR